MKDQYFGDFGDYQKISLLRNLRETNLSILVHWMKTSDDGSSDGRHVSYLNNPKIWMDYEPDIFEYIKQKIVKNKRSLIYIENSVFCKKIDFLNKKIENIKDRSLTLKSTIESSADLVFFDPDNGIEVKSTNPGNIHKYVTWKEIIETYKSGKSVFIYQHFSRSNRDEFTQNKLKEIREKIGKEAIALRVRHSVYFVIPQSKHKSIIDLSLQKFVKTWGHFSNLIYAQEE